MVDVNTETGQDEIIGQILVDFEAENLNNSEIITKYMSMVGATPDQIEMACMLIYVFVKFTEASA